jgi:hypothetical protein
MTIKYIRYPNITLEDDNWCEQIGGKYFDISEDTNTDYSELWSFENTIKYPHAFTLIKEDNRNIGYTLVYPTTIELMEKCMRKEQTEKELSDKILESVTYKNCDAIYISASMMIPEKEHKGYALRSIVNTIIDMDAARGNKITEVYFSAFSESTKKLSERAKEFAKKDGRNLHIFEYYAK